MVAAQVDLAVARRALLVAGLAWLSSAPAAAQPVRLEGAHGALVVEGDPLRLSLVDDGARERTRVLPAGLAWIEPGGARRELGRLDGVEREGDALVLRVETKRGVATLRARWRAERTLELAFRPPEGEAARAFEARLALAPAEAIWGLTERIADSWLFPVEPYPALIDLVPREVGGLDRRGETVSMWVVPTVAAYAPLYTSSAGYGLLVDGSWPGEFDVGDRDPEVLRLRFETGERPALRLRVFLGGPREVVDAYTALTGRPLRPPDWALRHWIWHDEHRASPRPSSSPASR